MLASTSTAWVLSLVVSFLFEMVARTGVQQRVELWAAAKLAAKLDLEWPMRLARMSTLELSCTRLAAPATSRR